MVTLWDPFGTSLGPLWTPFGTIRDRDTVVPNLLGLILGLVLYGLLISFGLLVRSFFFPWEHFSLLYFGLVSVLVLDHILIWLYMCFL